MSEKVTKEKQKKVLKKGTGKKSDGQMVQKFPFSTGGLNEDQIEKAWEEYLLANPSETIQHHQITVDSDGNEIEPAHAESDSAKEKAASKSSVTNTRSKQSKEIPSTTGEDDDAKKTAHQQQIQEKLLENIEKKKVADNEAFLLEHQTKEQKLEEMLALNKWLDKATIENEEKRLAFERSAPKIPKKDKRQAPTKIDGFALRSLESFNAKGAKLPTPEEEERERTEQRRKLDQHDIDRTNQNFDDINEFFQDQQGQDDQDQDQDDQQSDSEESSNRSYEEGYEEEMENRNDMSGRSRNPHQSGTGHESMMTEGLVRGLTKVIDNFSDTRSNTNFISNDQAPMQEVTENAVTKLEAQLTKAGQKPTDREWNRYISKPLQQALDLFLGDTWRKLSDSLMIQKLRDQIRGNTQKDASHAVLLGRLETIMTPYQGIHRNRWAENFNQLSKINSLMEEAVSQKDLTSKQKNSMFSIRKAIETMLNLTGIGRGILVFLRRRNIQDFAWGSWFYAVWEEYNTAQTCIVAASAYSEDSDSQINDKDDRKGLKRKERDTDNAGLTSKEKKKRDRDARSAATKNDKPAATRNHCRVCGRGSCEPGNCRFWDHPDANKEKGVAWIDSAKGKAWNKRKDKDGKHITCLPVHDCLDEKDKAKWTPPPKKGELTLVNEQENMLYDEKHKPSAVPVSMLNAMRTNTFNDFGPGKDIYCQPCNQKNDLVHDIDNVFSDADNNGMRYMTLLNTNSTLSDVRLKVLFDTGALGQGSNYISTEAAEKLKTAGYTAYRTNKKVCSCFVGSFKVIKQFYKIKLRYHDTTLNSNRTLTLKCDVIDTPHDMIIGFDSMKRCRMLRSLVFEALDQTSRANAKAKKGRGPLEREVTDKIQFPWEHDDYLALITTDWGSANWDDEGISYPDDTDDWNPYASVTTLNTSISTIESEQEYAPPKVIEGTTSMQKGIHFVCGRRRKVFSRSLNKEPAKIKPMKIELNGEWLSRENQLPPRVVSFMKGVEIENQTETMKDSGVIGESRAEAHSQVMLTVKPNGTWRFCIDYRRLNAVTKHNNWPLPKIKEMLERLGRKKAKWYGVIDLTKGYYQAPLHEDSRGLTAFITPDGLYEWNRVPMGLTGAGPYFQRAMATEVLSGLNHQICEVYLDDIIIHGKNEEEYLANLDTVLQRLEEYNITVNPDKCKLGLREVEYVGHLISEEGCHFSKEKLQKVIDVPLPMKAQELKSFLGLSNYFRDNVPNYAALTAPLQAMLTDYHAKRPLVWSQHPDAKKAFEETKKAVNECPKLFWMDTDLESEAHLYTDASKLGIGAYLCQRRSDGVEYPIAFFSKSLSGAEKNWGVPELEGYAIYAAFKQFDYLLRDIHTHVHTDHKNLCYIRDTGSEKVIRWKMHLQEYSFDLAYVPGPDNPIADFFSRDASALAEEDDYEVETPVKVANMLCTIMTDEYWPAVETIISNLNQDNETPSQGDAVRFNTTRDVDAPWLECNASWDKWVIPDDKYEVMKKVHNSTSGHHGVEATIAKLASLGHKWKGMREHVRRYCKECDTCQKHSYRQFEIKVPKFITGRYQPMEKISMDTIGPLPEDAEGNQHAVVIIDMFSRFMTIFPVKTTDAIDAAEALLNHCGHYGVPAQVQSDKGSQYVNDILAEFVELVGTEHIVGIAYSKEEQGIVERANGKVGEWVRKLIYDRKLERTLWSKFLPFVQRLHNASKVSTTGFAPCQILFGDQVQLDRSILLPVENRINPDDESLSEWMRTRRDAQDVIIQAAQEAQLELQEQAEFENRLAKDHTVFEVGSYVLLSYPDTGFGPRKPTKLHMMHKGPYQVLGREDNNVKLLNLVSNKHEWKQIHLLRKFYYDETRTDPIEIARRDYFDEFYIEKVLSHTGLRSRKSSLKFKIKWLGYSDITEEPWEHVRLNDAIHAYLRENNMANLIPKDEVEDPLAPYNPFPTTTKRAKKALKAQANAKVKPVNPSKASKVKKAKKAYEKLSREERAKRHAERRQ